MPDFVDSPWKALTSLRRGWGIAGRGKVGRAGGGERQETGIWHAKFKTIAFKFKNK